MTEWYKIGSDSACIKNAGKTIDRICILSSAAAPWSAREWYSVAERVSD
jgi:hypothetical protein